MFSVPISMAVHAILTIPGGNLDAPLLAEILGE